MVEIEDIKLKIRKNIDEYLSDEENKQLVQYIKWYGKLCGGAIVSILNDDKIRDYDWFFEDKKGYDLIYDQLKKDVFSFYYTDNAITYRKLQFIHLHINTIPNIIKHFDFIHCAIGYDYYKDKLYFMDNTLDCIKNKKIIIQENHTPLSTFCRMYKYISRGFTVDDETINDILKFFGKYTKDFETFNENFKDYYTQTNYNMKKLYNKVKLQYNQLKMQLL